MYRIKVCGMKYPENIKETIQIGPDYIGFIFYKKSKRFVDDASLINLEVPATIKKVGVFVNSTIKEIIQYIENYKLDIIQLHGDETAIFCTDLKEAGVKIIKAFQLSDYFDFSQLKDYDKVCDFFLFDTKTNMYGGSGRKFNWEILEKYDNKKAFFLSGGIDLTDIQEIKNLKNLNIHALDINSNFELGPGMKDVVKIRKFKQGLIA